MTTSSMGQEQTGANCILFPIFYTITNTSLKNSFIKFANDLLTQRKTLSLKKSFEVP